MAHAGSLILAAKHINYLLSIQTPIKRLVMEKKASLATRESSSEVSFDNVLADGFETLVMVDAHTW